METINQTFLNDYNSLSREDFLSKYKDVKILTESPLTIDKDKPYILIDGNNHYELFMSWNLFEGTYYPYYDENDLVKNAAQLKQINTGITVEHLIIGLYRCYIDVDDIKQRIIDAALLVINSDCKGIPSGKKWKVNRTYGDWQYILVSPQKRTGIARAAYGLYKAEGLIDPELSIEDNMERVGCSKATLLKYCDYYDIHLKSAKEINNFKVMQLCQENSGKSYRELESICKNAGLKVSKSTLQRLLA